MESPDYTELLQRCRDNAKKAEEGKRFLDFFTEEQEKYSADSIESQSFKLAVAAILFCMNMENERIRKKFSEKTQQRMEENEKRIREGFKEYYAVKKNPRDDISLDDVPKMIACLKELIEKCDKNTEIYAAVQRSLEDIETAMNNKQQFEIFIKSV